MNIETRIEGERGCGYRKQGGKYLMGGAVAFACGKLPIPLDSCPCCGHGIKFSRGFQWIGADLIKSQLCNPESRDRCLNCQPFRGADDGTIKKLGLMWIGEKFYKTPYDFTRETQEQGLSKRISTIPKGMVLGETWIMLAHKKAITAMETPDLELLPVPVKKPGIFAMFIPQSLEYVVREKNGKVIDGQKKLRKLEKRGFKLVRVQKKEK